MKRFTKGPWQNNPPRTQTITTPDGKEIAMAVCANKDWEANARLIAASPYLLEACHDLLDILSDHPMTIELNQEVIDNIKNLLGTLK